MTIVTGSMNCTIRRARRFRGFFWVDAENYTYIGQNRSCSIISATLCHLRWSRLPRLAECIPLTVIQSSSARTAGQSAAFA